MLGGRLFILVGETHDIHSLLGDYVICDVYLKEVVDGFTV